MGRTILETVSSVLSLPDIIQQDFYAPYNIYTFARSMRSKRLETTIKPSTE